MRIIFILLLLVTFNTTSKAQSNSKITPPNIIFILADDLGWADLPMYGNTFNEAPNLELLANEGVKFTNAYAANPVCSPTRASIQTGLYPARIGINDWIPGHWRPFEKVLAAKNTVQHLPLNNETLGELLKKAGYVTGFFGKWHLGGDEKYYPKNRGYDESVIFDSAPYFGYESSLKPPIETATNLPLSETLTNLSTDFITKNQDKPFFLFLSHFDVHVQLDAQEELIQKYVNKPKSENYPSNAVYAAMIENIDQSVGRIMTKLKALDLEKNTLIVFFSDNGGLVTRFDKIPLLAAHSLPFYENDTLRYIASSNKPLRGEKGTVFEGGIREPLLIKWPGMTKSGTENNALISSIDFFPTFLAIANGTLKPNQIIDGKNILEEIKGENKDQNRTLFWHYPVYHHDVPASAVRQGDWKLIEYLDDKHIELYNLKEDIGETTDVSKKHPKKARELLHLLHNWRKDVKAEMPKTNPDFDESKRHLWGKYPDDL
jgi:uncharacterized sulfatase